MSRSATLAVSFSVVVLSDGDESIELASEDAGGGVVCDGVDSEMVELGASDVTAEGADDWFVVRYLALQPLTSTNKLQVSSSRIRVTDAPAPDDIGYCFAAASELQGVMPGGATLVGHIHYDNGASDEKTDRTTSLWFRHASYQKPTSVSLSVGGGSGGSTDCGSLSAAIGCKHDGSDSWVN